MMSPALPAPVGTVRMKVHIRAVHCMYHELDVGDIRARLDPDPNDPQNHWGGIVRMYRIAAIAPVVRVPGGSYRDSYIQWLDTFEIEPRRWMYGHTLYEVVGGPKLVVANTDPTSVRIERGGYAVWIKDREESC